MTEISFSHTDIPDSRIAGEFVGKNLLEGLGGEAPHAVIVFASSAYDAEVLLRALQESSHAPNIVGSTSAGEFATAGFGTGSISALAIRSTDIRFSVSLGEGIDRDPSRAARDLAAPLIGIKDFSHPFRTLLVLADALAGQSEELIGLLNQASGGLYQIFGGGSGDDAKFSSTLVFRGAKAYRKSVVALEMLSKKPIGIGIAHGWKPASEPMRVTRADGMRILGLNAATALEAFREYALKTGQELDVSDPLPFFLHNILGIETVQGFKLRVPLRIEADGSILCAAEVPEGAAVRIMSSSAASTTAAAVEAAGSALRGLAGNKPKAVLFFDCVATRLRMGKDFGNELQAMAEVMGNVPYVGCNTYGQIARIDGQFGGFHNCTAVVCALPD